MFPLFSTSSSLVGNSRRLILGKAQHPQEQHHPFLSECAAFGERGWLSGQSVGLVIERSLVRVPAGAAGEFSSPGSTFCADSYFGIRSTPLLLQ